jgi:hypothetical protein|eukprot:COSAG01_NODE_6705_length_3536_cov_2.091359_3_plen_96_part_00
MELRFDSPAPRKFYPDYNLMFIPMRHLVLQGSVNNPKSASPGSSLRYASVQDLQAAAAQIVHAMQEPASASQVAARLAPFFTSRYCEYSLQTLCR